METSSKKNIIIGVVVVVVVVLVGYLIWKAPGGGGPTAVPEGATTTAQGAVVAPGTSAISTSTGEVVTRTGVVTKNNVTPGSPEAPQQSAPIVPSQVPSAIKLTVTAASGFVPNTFTVQAGKAVTIAVTSGDTQTHVFMFDDPLLSAVAIGVGPGETRAITFNAPSTPGTYAFHCDVPGHKARGEVGKMIVQ